MDSSGSSSIVLFRMGEVQRSCTAYGSGGVPFQCLLPFTEVVEQSG